jgi:mannose-1-phosphate guanylyltransferase
MKIVIRAGGVGERLWPYSRQESPKQFHNFLGKNTLLQETFHRVRMIVPVKSIFVSVQKGFKQNALQGCKSLPKSNIFEEPACKNTGPAIVYEVAWLKNSGIKPTEAIGTIPADDYTRNPQEFKKIVKAIEQYIKKVPDHVVIPGVLPAKPDAGFSYLRKGKSLGGPKGVKLWSVAEWIEKPSLKKCKEIINKKNYLAHTGMYFWQLGNITREIEANQRGILLAANQALHGKPKNYCTLKPQTVESALTRSFKNLTVVDATKVGWSDVGKWHVIKALLETSTQGNASKGQVISIDSRNNLLFGVSKKVLAVLDVDDLVIVDTADALLVVSQERSGEIKKLVKAIKKKGLSKYL